MGIADFMGRMGVEVWGNWCKRFISFVRCIKIESELTQKNTSKSPLSIINYKNPSRNYSTLTITPSEVTVDVRPVS